MLRVVLRNSPRSTLVLWPEVRTAWQDGKARGPAAKRFEAPTFEQLALVNLSLPRESEGDARNGLRVV